MVRDGNSWAIRLPKQALQDSGIEPGASLVLRTNPGRITIYSVVAARRADKKDKFEATKQDVQKIWNEAFEQVWLDIFGADE